MSRIFFSYAWGDNTEDGKNRETSVNQLYDSLREEGFKLVRDKVDLGYKGLISGFMQQIGKGDSVIVAITDKYLRSPYCMFELYEIARNSRFDKSAFVERIFPIMVEYIDFTQPAVVDKYISFWKEKQKEWTDLFSKHMDNLSLQQFDRYDKERLIRDNIGKLMDWLNDMNTLNTELLSHNNFNLLKKAIKGSSENSFPEMDWDKLVDEIEKGSCVIFLGNGLLSGNDGELYTELCNQLAKRYPNYISDYYAEDNLFLFKTPAYREKFAGLLESHYKNLQADKKIYQLLAELPVHLYISISPDNILGTVFGEQVNIISTKDIKTGKQKIEDTAKPLLYQIFGRVSDSDGFILSHDDQFEFLKNILGGHGMPGTVQQFFFSDNASGEVIFLGFDFSKWHMHLLLRIFELGKPNIKLNRTALGDNDLPEQQKNFASNQFQVEFVEKHMIEFVKTLHQKCAERGILRTILPGEKNVESATESSSQKLEALKKEIAEAFKRLRDFDEKLLFSQDADERIRFATEIEKEKKTIDNLKGIMDSIAVKA